MINSQSLSKDIYKAIGNLKQISAPIKKTKYYFVFKTSR